MKKRMDSFGRIEIPKSIRNALSLRDNDCLFIDYRTEKDEIVMKKAAQNCIVCGSSTGLISLKQNLFLCKQCLLRLNEKVER